jgi:hypothetical protein
MSFISRATVQRATSKPFPAHLVPDLAHAVDLEVLFEDALGSRAFSAASRFARSDSDRDRPLGHVIV